MIGSKFDF